MSEIINNLQLYQYLLSVDMLQDRQAEYARLLPSLKFKVKSYGWLMRQGEIYSALERVKNGNHSQN